jgi:hypothetical protein
MRNDMKNIFTLCGLVTIAVIQTPLFWAYSGEYVTDFWKAVAVISTGLANIGYIFKGAKD